MSDTKLQEKIIDALKTVQDPDLNKDIASESIVIAEQLNLWIKLLGITRSYLLIKIIFIIQIIFQKHMKAGNLLMTSTD